MRIYAEIVNEDRISWRFICVNEQKTLPLWRKSVDCYVNIP